MKFTKKDLRNGDVVKCSNGEIAIVIPDTDVMIFENGLLCLNAISDNLMSNHTDLNVGKWDIVAVRRPRCAEDCYFNAFDSETGALVYERKEAEEMTLEEVCKALGKEIKIVKSK